MCSPCQVEAARAAAFEDSDSDFDKLVEINKRRLQAQKSPAIVEDGANNEAIEDEMSKMSVGQKMALFRKLEEEEKEKKKNTGSRRFLDRRKRMERSRTQPITEEEIGAAAVIAKEQKSESEAQHEDEVHDQGSEVTSSMSLENLSVDSSEVHADQENGDQETMEDELSKYVPLKFMKLSK